MQEFSSVTASSYDADALAPLLSEKSADGWDVVSIVSAGTNIVAYLRREASGDTVTDETVENDEGVDTAFVPVPVEEPVVEEPVVEEPVADEPVVEEITAEEPAAQPVDEPAGWGTAPETTEPEPVVAPVVEEQAAAESAPVESAVPAGWYADPSGRYELRYWDGNAWTEHVSRAGQQFTDPPVA
ncbi:MAG: DUF2510 domain-containing protein [Ilumatobacteraceae bacterium]